MEKGKIEKITYNIKEAIEATGLGEWHWRRAVECGDIPHSKIGNRILFTREDLFKHVEKQRKIPQVLRRKAKA